MDLEQKEQLLKVYCDNELQGLKQICNPMIYKKGITQTDTDYDELISLALETLRDSTERYHDTQNCKFNTFLIGNIKRTFFDWTRDSNRIKRKCPGKMEYFDAPSEDGIDLKEKIASDFNIEKEVLDDIVLSSDKRIEQYLEALSEKQREIATLIMKGYEPSEIQGILNISEKEYHSAMSVMKSYDKSKLLRRDINNHKIQREDYSTMETIVTTSEKTKDTHYSIESISKKMKRHQLRDDHVLQRSCGQWNNLYKSELISDILQGKSLTQIIVSEEIKDGITMHWLIDGKQRCTNMDDFLNDGFAISKNVQRYEIQYQTIIKDTNGNDTLNEEGFAIPVNQTFDIRKKKFSQLPEELQDRFKEYQIPVMLNLNCTKKEIAYDIARFNRCRPMNPAQNGWTGFDEGYACYVDNILKMNFFSEDYPYTSYRESNNRSGMLRRMIVEGIMTVNYIDDFNKDFRKLCKYLSDEANDSTFIEFYAMIERLSAIANEEFANIFTIKDSFLWFGLFSRFEKLGIKHTKFVDFVKAFHDSLYQKKRNGISFEMLSESSTKDKNIVIKKINHLEALMLDYYKA